MLHCLFFCLAMSRSIHSIGACRFQMATGILPDRGIPGKNGRRHDHSSGTDALLGGGEIPQGSATTAHRCRILWQGVHQLEAVSCSGPQMVGWLCCLDGFEWLNEWRVFVDRIIIIIFHFWHFFLCFFCCFTGMSPKRTTQIQRIRTSRMAQRTWARLRQFGACWAKHRKSTWSILQVLTKIRNF